MPLNNHTVEIELCEQAKAICAQYDLGNKATARAMFNQVPVKRQALMAGYMAAVSNWSTARLIVFLKSIAE